MSVRNIFQCYCYVVRTSFLFEMLIYNAQPINLVVEEISWNKSVVQTPITHFIYQKENNVFFRHSSMLPLMKSGAEHHFSALIWRTWFFLMWSIFQKFVSVFSYEKLTVKTTLTTTGHFFAKNLNYCPSDIICNSIALKCQCLKDT